MEMYEADFIIEGKAPKNSRDLRFTIPNVPANRDLLIFLDTRAHEMMRDVIRELHTVAKIKVGTTIPFLTSLSHLHSSFSATISRFPYSNWLFLFPILFI